MREKCTNTGKYVPAKTLYLGTFYAVGSLKNLTSQIPVFISFTRSGGFDLHQ